MLRAKSLMIHPSQQHRSVTVTLVTMPRLGISSSTSAASVAILAQVCGKSSCGSVGCLRSLGFFARGMARFNHTSEMQELMSGDADSGQCGAETPQQIAVDGGFKKKSSCGGVRSSSSVCSGGVLRDGQPQGQARDVWIPSNRLETGDGASVARISSRFLSWRRDGNIEWRRNRSTRT